jgi:F0F1-type ATP synthase membrane subunit b/b'
VQTLVNVALWDLFPEQCKELRAIKQDIRDIFSREQTRRISAVAQDIDNTEVPLRRALREEVVDYVIKLFPYVVVGFPTKRTAFI